jgi:hypothetical protein
VHGEGSLRHFDHEEIAIAALAVESLPDVAVDRYAKRQRVGLTRRVVRLELAAGEGRRTQEPSQREGCPRKQRNQYEPDGD